MLTLGFSYLQDNILGQHCRTALTGQPKTARIGQLEHESRDKIPGQEIQVKTVETGQPGQDTWDRTRRTGHLGQQTQNRKPETGCLGQDRTAKTVHPGTGHPGQDTQDRTPRTGHPKQDTWD
jgi:hypothetical protein